MRRRSELVREVAKRGIDNAELLCEDMSADTLQATLRWFDGKQNTSPSILAWKLKSGGVYVPDEEAEPTIMVWKLENRLAWIERHMPAEMERDYGFQAEVALISCVRAGLPVSVVKVRQMMGHELRVAA